MSVKAVLNSLFPLKIKDNQIRTSNKAGVNTREAEASRHKRKKMLLKY